MKRRSFLQRSLATSAWLTLGGLDFLLPPVSAVEARLDSAMVRFHAEIEPWVRFLENTPRDKVLEEVAARIRRGLTYRELVAALLLAGIRNIQPRPVGFKFHAVLVVHSAHLASLASPESERWLPIFWAIDQFKSSQAADVREGDWTMGPVNEALVPPAHKARQAFISAMDNWDESAADAAVVGLVRGAGAHELFELFCRYGARDFREIGHKAIYVANSFRALEVIGWHHAEPVLRSLAYALLDRDGEKKNPATADLPADRPFRRNVEALAKVRPDWLEGKTDAGAARELLQSLRSGSALEAGQNTLALLNRGVSTQSLFEGIWGGAGELVMRSPGILSIHAATFTNAIHYSFRHCRDEQTRCLLLLQNASFIPLYRGNRPDQGVRLDELEPQPGSGDAPASVEEILGEISRNKLNASRKILAWLRANPDPRPLMDAARRLIFLKGRDAHDYKFSSAVLEDCAFLSTPWRDRYLAASVFNWVGADAADNNLVSRTRAALGT